MKLSHILNVLLSIAIIAIITMASVKPETKEAIVQKISDNLPQIIQPITISKQFDFAGEVMPQNQGTLERLDRELTVNSYWHSNTILTLKRSKKYFPLIDQILAEEGVPQDFKYIAVIESSLENVTSPAGAKGLWQIMPAVGTHYGLISSSGIEERYNVEKATRVACKLIKDYKNKFGTWTNAAAAYNMGEGNFSKELSSQKESTYYDMNFGAETNRYLFRILAAKEIFSNPNNYGFYLNPQDYYYPTYTKDVVVTSSIQELADFAHQHNCSYRELKELNPWLTSNSLTVRPNQTFILKVPG